MTKPSDTVKILIVEDDSAAARALGLLSEEYGDVTHAASGREAIELMKQHSFSLVITDYEMKNGNGLVVSTFISESKRTCPVIMITGHGTKDLAIKALNKHVFRFIEKPFDNLQVKQAIELAISAHQEMSVLSAQADRGKQVDSILDSLAMPVENIESALGAIKKDALDAESLRHFERATAEAARIREVINLTKNDIRLNKGHLREETFELIDLLDEIKVTLLPNLIKNRTVLFLSENVVTSLRGDRVLIGHAIKTLIIQGIEALALSSSDRWISIDVKTRNGEKQLVLQSSGQRSGIVGFFKELIGASTSIWNERLPSFSVVKNIILGHGGHVFASDSSDSSKMIISLPAA